MIAGSRYRALSDGFQTDDALLLVSTPGGRFALIQGVVLSYRRLSLWRVGFSFHAMELWELAAKLTIERKKSAKRRSLGIRR